jgi:CheY-like chemotaxis protein
VSCDTTALRILVADDNRDAADALTMLLEMGGHEVATVYDGEAALDAALGRQPHLCIFDIGMPKLNGYEVARAVRQACPAAVLVAVSGWGNRKDVELAYASGFHEHFTKPAAIADVESVIHRISRSGAI